MAGVKVVSRWHDRLIRVGARRTRTSCEATFGNCSPKSFRNRLLRRWVISQSSACRAVVDCRAGLDEPFGLSFGALDGVRLDDVDYDADADAVLICFVRVPAAS